MLGKWHLGDFDTRPEFNPLRHGFGSSSAFPTRTTIGRPFVQDAERGVPLYRGFDQVERPVDANTLTQRFTDEALRFIREPPGAALLPLHRLQHAAPAGRGASSAFTGTSTCRPLRRRD